MSTINYTDISNYVQDKVNLIENNIKKSVYPAKTKVLSIETNLLQNAMQDLLSTINTKKEIKKKNDEIEAKLKLNSAAMSREVCSSHEQLSIVKWKLNKVHDELNTNYAKIRGIHEDIRVNTNYFNNSPKMSTKTIKTFLNQDGFLADDVQNVENYLKNSEQEDAKKLCFLEIMEKCLNEELSKLNGFLMYDDECISKKNDDIIEMKNKKKLDKENIRKEMENLQRKIEEAFVFNKNQIYKLIKLKLYKEKQNVNEMTDKNSELQTILKNMINTINSGSKICPFQNMTNIPSDITLLLLELDQVLKDGDEISFDISVLSKQIDKQSKDVEFAAKRLENLQLEKSKRVINKKIDEQDKSQKLNKTSMEIINIVKANRLLMDKLNIHSDIGEEYKRLKEVYEKIISEKSKQNLTKEGYKENEVISNQLEIDCEDDSLVNSNRKNTVKIKNTGRKLPQNRRRKISSSHRLPVVSEINSSIISSQFNVIKHSKALKTKEYNKNQLVVEKNHSMNKLFNENKQNRVNKKNNDEIHDLNENQSIPVEEISINVNSTIRNNSKEGDKQKVKSKRSNNESHMYGTPAKLRTVERKSKNNKTSFQINSMRESAYSFKSIETNPEEYNLFVNDIKTNQFNSSSSPKKNVIINNRREANLATLEIPTTISKNNTSQFNFSIRRESNESSGLTLYCNLEDEGTSDSSLDDM